jgi:hypothetical protein
LGQPHADRRMCRPIGSIRTIARSGVTVTCLLCDPLPYKNVLKVPHAKNLGENTVLELSVQNVPSVLPDFPACGTPDRDMVSRL